ncbi:MAG: YebC/PmpR family DNA-binding transcriptional regulator [Holosporales bacterium]|jgi:YebC/PmpR family DNA-binding regulatory protein|nr:YebC/PmpR family DNA-binding transcriptional regulator [Holosporales bacterium]
MSGHSQFKNIMYRKGAQDAKRAKTFAKLGREILVAAKSGSDPQSNPRLRSALAAARTVNMPSDNINRIMKKAAGGEELESYEDVRFEGFGPGGVAVIVEALTDNRNRTVPEMRSIFSKFGGNLGEIGSVNFMFEHIGIVVLSKEDLFIESLFEKAVDAGADNLEENEGEFVITTSVGLFGQVRDYMTEQVKTPLSSEIVWRPINTIDCDFETTKTLFRMVDVLEDNDDVQKVFTNFSCSDEVQHKIDEEFNKD